MGENWVEFLIFTSKLNAIATRAIAAHYRRVAGARAADLETLQTASVSVIQRFGSSLNLNIHFHQLWVEGVFGVPKPQAASSVDVSFYKASRPSERALAQVLETIQRRVVRLLVKRGLLNGDGSRASSEESDPGSCLSELSADSQLVMHELMGASVQNRIALGQNQGARVRRVGSFGIPGERSERAGKGCAALSGFSLHAAVGIEARIRRKPASRGSASLNERRQARLEKLCRYVSRGAVSESRLHIEENGEVSYQLKNPWSDGTTAVRFTPIDFVEKLAALVPPPRVHQIRYHGVFAPNHAWRKWVVPGQAPERAPKRSNDQLPEAIKAECGPKGRRMSWAECLKRTFQIDLTQCPDCGGEVRFVSAIHQRDAIQAILSHLGIESAERSERVNSGSLWDGIGGEPRGPPMDAWDEHCQVIDYRPEF